MSMQHLVFNDANNVFLPESISKEWIQAKTSKNIDIFSAFRQANWATQPDKWIKGIALVAVSSEDIEEIIEAVNTAPDYMIIGEGDIVLAGTNINLQALLIDAL
jgi:hypothetical protein